MKPKSIIVGTAGHIDHGKTLLVKALTGIDADRLQEEKRRGITIDLGFAHMELETDDGGKKIRFGFVDVPGHEKFVRNMLAGIGGIDLVLLVIAADEGVKPQTREHFEICKQLNVQRGITVLTKSDMVDAGRMEATRQEVADFVRGTFLDSARSPIIAVSSTSGAGLDFLKKELARLAEESVERDSSALFRLPIDRVFVMKGFGTVVTGTMISGSVKKDDEVEVFPSGRKVRVRSVQVHGKTAENSVAGERTALNLAGVSKEDISRGMVLAAPGIFRTTKRLGVELHLWEDAKPMRDRAQVHLHTFASETTAEVVLTGERVLQPGKTCFAQLRLKDPLLALPGDRFIMRQISPVVTIGGGVVLDNAPLSKSPKPEVLEGFLSTVSTGSESESLLARIARRGKTGLTLWDSVAETGLRPERIESVLKPLTAKGAIARSADVFITTENFDDAQKTALTVVNAFHNANPLVAGISRQELREKSRLPGEVFVAVLDQLLQQNKIGFSGEQVRAAGRTVVMKDDESEAKQAVERAFAIAGLKVPALKDVLAGLQVEKARAQKLVTLLLRDRILVRLGDDLVFHQSALEALRQNVRAHKAKSNRIDVAGFKELTGVSRKYAIPLLEFLDRERITRREGNSRVIL